MFLDSKLDFDGHIKVVFDKTSKFIVLFTSSEIFYRDHLFYKSINLLLDLPQITVILSRIRLLQGIFDPLLIRFLSAAQELKILFITSFTVPTFQLHEIPFSMKSQLLTDPLQIKMKSKFINLSFMETQPILSMITN